MSSFKFRVRDEKTNEIIGYEWFNSSLNNGFSFIDLREINENVNFNELPIHSDCSEPGMLKGSGFGRLVREQYTGLKDSIGTEGYFGDTWEIKNFVYRVKETVGFTRKICDLRFKLIQGELETKYELIDNPKDLTNIALNVIFNLENKNGRRIFVDDYRKKLQIISVD